LINWLIIPEDNIMSNSNTDKIIEAQSNVTSVNMICNALDNIAERIVRDILKDKCFMEELKNHLKKAFLRKIN
jgi:hypothetical protein